MMMKMIRCFCKEGRHIVCGGTTSCIAAQYLEKEVKRALIILTSNLLQIESLLRRFKNKQDSIITRIIGIYKDECKEDGSSEMQDYLKETTDINFSQARQ